MDDVILHFQRNQELLRLVIERGPLYYIDVPTKLGLEIGMDVEITGATEGDVAEWLPDSAIIE